MKKREHSNKMRKNQNKKSVLETAREKNQITLYIGRRLITFSKFLQTITANLELQVTSQWRGKIKTFSD